MWANSNSQSSMSHLSSNTQSTYALADTHAHPHAQTPDDFYHYLQNAPMTPIERLDDVSTPHWPMRGSTSANQYTELVYNENINSINDLEVMPRPSHFTLPPFSINQDHYWPRPIQSDYPIFESTPLDDHHATSEIHTDDLAGLYTESEEENNSEAATSTSFKNSGTSLQSRKKTKIYKTHPHYPKDVAAMISSLIKEHKVSKAVVYKKVAKKYESNKAMDTIRVKQEILDEWNYNKSHGRSGRRKKGAKNPYAN